MNGNGTGYGLMENHRNLEESYPRFSIYLSILGFKHDWKDVLKRLPHPAAAVSSP